MAHFFDMKITFFLGFVLLVINQIWSQCDSYEEPNVWNQSWLSCQTSIDPATTGPASHWVQYSFDQVYIIDSLHLWNYNVDIALVNNGVQHFEVYSSLDSIDWTMQGTFTASPASGMDTYEGEGFAITQSFNSKYLLLRLLDNHGGSCTGISELRIGVDDETCEDFQPQVMIEYAICDQYFELSVSPLDSNSSYSFDWSTGAGDTSTISVMDEGTYGLIISDHSCTRAFDIVLRYPSVIFSGWAKDTLIPIGQYYSTQSVNTSGIVTYGREVQMYVSGGIELIDDFQVTEDGLLEVHLIDCGDSTGIHKVQSTVSYGNPKTAHKDYIGNGHITGVYAITSDSSDAMPSLTGLGGLTEEAAYRFLAQATFGGNESMRAELNNLGVAEWIDWQVEIPHESYFNHLYFVMKYDQPAILYWTNWHRTWWHNILTGDSYLRDRMAYALSQIVVISSKSFILNFGDGLTAYYDILSKHAFGNYRDVLYEVTLNPMMGFYLSHMNNPKTDTSANQFPDENYAREILQLFSIGLYELNIDGTRKQDSLGNDIPTYDNDDIIEFAKVFTGLGTAGRPFGMPVNLVANRYIKSYMTEAMIMHEDQHEPGPKTLLNNYTVPAGQSGMEDINDAIDNIFNHPNVGPFIGRQLIQRFVKSHPTPAYVQRVAEVFNDNGQGVRGDLKAVIKAVLLDQEARDCSWVIDSDHGKLKEPLLRFSQLYKAFDIQSTSGTFYSEGLSIEESTDQAPLRAPSVFNFYQTTYRPPGILSDADLDAPEFQILNSTTSIGYANMIDSIIVQNEVLALDKGVSSLDFTPELALVGDHDQLIQHLNDKLTNGTLQPTTISILMDALDQITSTDPMDKVRMAVYLIAISPEYVTLK